MSTPVRQRRGYGTLVLGLAALAAAAGGLYWYFNGEGSLGSTWFRPSTRVKRKSVLIVLDQVMSLYVSGSPWQHILTLLPSYEESQSYADLYVICPPTVQASYDDPELRKCLSHESRLLHCSTREGLVHIAKHIGSDVVILGEEYSWAVEKLRGSLIPHPNAYGRLDETDCGSAAQTIRNPARRQRYIYHLDTKSNIKGHTGVNLG
jgi:hypothetical protein